MYLTKSPVNMESTIYGLLKGKKGIIFGALEERSIAWAIAERVHAEGGEFILSNAPVAKRVGTLDKLAELTGSEIIWADATSDEDLAGLFEAAKSAYGSVDFIVHAIGMGLNVRKNRPYENLNYAWLNKTLDISAISPPPNRSPWPRNRRPRRQRFDCSSFVYRSPAGFFGVFRNGGCQGAAGKHRAFLSDTGWVNAAFG